jgi:hypothetical protein
MRITLAVFQAEGKYWIRSAELTMEVRAMMPLRGKLRAGRAYITAGHVVTLLLAYVTPVASPNGRNARSHAIGGGTSSGVPFSTIKYKYVKIILVTPCNRIKFKMVTNKKKDRDDGRSGSFVVCALHDLSSEKTVQDGYANNYVLFIEF